MKRLLALLLTSAICIPAEGRIHGGMPGASPPFTGCGSTGFLATCSSNFNITNAVLQSQTFTNATWAKTGTGVAAPTITANSAVAPDSTMTASTLTLPAVSGAGNGSYIAQSGIGFAGQWPYIADVYVRGVVGGEKIWLASQSTGSDFSRIAITATTSWVRVPLPWIGKAANQVIEIGVDLRDGSQSAQSAQSVYIWGAQAITGQTEFAYVPTTTVAVSAIQNVALPASTAFRDFGPLTYVGGGVNPIIPQNTISANAGGVSGPYVNATSNIAGTLFATTNCTPSGVNRNTFPNQCLYSAAANNLQSWALNATNPAFTATPAAWDDQYLAHSTWAPPSTCSLATWCVYYSATDSTGPDTGAWGIGVATSSDAVHFTKYAGNPLTFSAPSVPRPGLPWLMKDGSTLYMYTTRDGNNSTSLVVWTSPVGDGVNWTFAGISLFPPISGDWDNSCPGGGTVAGEIDPFVFKNSHGFYEMAYTQFCRTPLSQRIGYAISNSPLGPWWKYDAAPIVTNNSTAYPGTDIPGDSVFMQDGITFSYIFNDDNGFNSALGLLSTMPDH
jgi:hypothetical protein